MAITIKKAQTPAELDDVLWIRHEVYVIEDGKFGGQALPGGRIVDRFDVIPDVTHLIAYEGAKPVATLRVNRDLGGGLPSEDNFDFSPIRDTFLAGAEGAPVVACGGMLAVRKAWRARRDVIRALYKIAASVFAAWGTTHILATVNHETAPMYRRLGFVQVGEKRWVEHIGNFVIPLVAAAADYYDWAFGELAGPPLKLFRDSFERLLLRSGERVFNEGEDGDRAYVIDSGSVKISRIRPDGSHLVLALLGRGDLFGELSLIDHLPRSATAESLGDVELISLDRDTFTRQTGMDSAGLRGIMNFFSSRMRKTEELAMVLAFGNPERRMEFALDTIRTGARPDSKSPETLVARITAEDLARAALVETEQAAAFLRRMEQAGEIRLGRNSIRFVIQRTHDQPPAGTI
jgi:CRP-like cAMP-binding protein